MKTIPYPRPGDKITADLIRNILDTIREITPIAGPNVRTTRTNHGTHISAVIPDSTASNKSIPHLFEVRWFSDANEGNGGWGVFLISGYDVYVDGRPVDAIGCEKGQLTALDGDAWGCWNVLPNEVWETGGDLWLNVRIPKPNEETGETDEAVSAEFSDSAHDAEDNAAWYQSYLIADFSRCKLADGTYEQPVIDQLFVGALALSSGSASKEGDEKEGYSGYVTSYGPARYGLPMGAPSDSREYGFWQASQTLRYENGRLIEVTDNDEEEICGTTPITEEGLY